MVNQELSELAIKNLEEEIDNPDREVAHVNADEILCKLLINLGYYKVIDAYNKVDKYYS